MFITSLQLSQHQTLFQTQINNYQNLAGITDHDDHDLDSILLSCLPIDVISNHMHLSTTVHMITGIQQQLYQLSCP